MIVPDAVDQMADLGLTADHFSRRENALVWETLARMRTEGAPGGMVALTLAMGDQGHLSEAGGVARVSGLPERVDSTVNVSHYGQRVIDAAFRRRSVAAAQQTQAAAQDVKVTADELRTVIAGAATGLLESEEAGRGEDIETLLRQWERRNEERRLALERGEELGIPTGIPAIDTRLGVRRMERGTMVIVAARPAMGKTSFALEVMRHALNRGIGVGFFSLEMSVDQLLTKLMSLEADVPTDVIDRHRYTERQRGAKNAAGGRMIEWPIWINDSASRSVESMGAISRRWQRMATQRGAELGLIVVDYLQLARAEGTTEQEIVSSVSRGLMQIAKGLGVVVLAIAQLNRKADARGDGRPRMADLRASGQLEQDAAQVFLLHRPAMHDPQEVARDESPHVRAARLEAQAKAEIIIAKDRIGGASGIVPLHFDGSTQRFRDVPDRWAAK